MPARGQLECSGGGGNAVVAAACSRVVSDIIRYCVGISPNTHWEHGGCAGRMVVYTRAGGEIKITPSPRTYSMGWLRCEVLRGPHHKTTPYTHTHTHTHTDTQTHTHTHTRRHGSLKRKFTMSVERNQSRKHTLHVFLHTQPGRARTNTRHTSCLPQRRRPPTVSLLVSRFVAVMVSTHSPRTMFKC
jgi:hypothetical protein